MAASAIPINGTDVIVQISEDSGSSYDTVGHATSCSFTTSREARDITTKDSGGWRDVRPGKGSWSVSFEGLVTYSAVSDIDKPNDIYTLYANRTGIRIRFGSLTTGEFEYTGDCFIMQYSQEAGTEDNNTYSCTVEGDGAPTQAAVS